MKILTLEAPVSVAAGAMTQIPGSYRKTGFTAWLNSVGVGTYQLQISPDETTWVDEGSALTADGHITVTAHARAIRWNCTAFTSGAPTSQAIFDE